jgi:hypothetical protein
VNKYGFGDLCNFVHQFYNKRPPARGTVVTDCVVLYILSLFVSETQLCHCAYLVTLFDE